MNTPYSFYLDINLFDLRGNYRAIVVFISICKLDCNFMLDNRFFVNVFIGALKTYKAIAIFLFAKIPHESLSRLKPADVATAYLIKSLDAFLIALVLLIFSYGVYSLFISKHSELDESGVLKWVRIPSIAHLKNTFAEVIIVILFVKFLEVALLNSGHLTWELLVLPCSILLLALSLKFPCLRFQSSSKD